MRQLPFETNFRDSLSWEIGRPDVRNELVLERVGKVTRRVCVTDVLKWPVWVCGREQALSVRPDRRAVGADRAGGARAAVGWSSSGAFEALPRGRHPLRQPHRVRVASTAARLSTVGDGVLVPQALREDGVVDRLHDALRDRVRDARDRDPMASAGCVDAQSVKGADTVGAAVRGFDAGKKVNGRKRHVVVHTMGLLLLVVITSASVQDRDRPHTAGPADDGDAVAVAAVPTAATPASWSTGPRRLPTSPSRSCVNPWESRCSRCFHGGGWSSVPSPGS